MFAWRRTQHLFTAFPLIISTCNWRFSLVFQFQFKRESNFLCNSTINTDFYSLLPSDLKFQFRLVFTKTAIVLRHKKGSERLFPPVSSFCNYLRSKQIKLSFKKWQCSGFQCVDLYNLAKWKRKVERGAHIRLQILLKHLHSKCY